MTTPHRPWTLGLQRAALLALTAALGACASVQVPAYDYSAWQRNQPASLLVLPPINETPSVLAGYSVLSHATMPLAEAGYYVVPVTLMDETFRQNGLTVAQDIQEVPGAKLREIFGADAAVYLRVRRYGTRYAVVASETVVAVEARIVDLRSGDLLWQGSAQASSAEQQQSSQGGLVGLLIQAVVSQVVNTATDAAHNYAGVATGRLLAAPRAAGVLPGPRSPQHGQPARPR